MKKSNMKCMSAVLLVAVGLVVSQSMAGIQVLQGTMAAGELTVSVTNTTGRALVLDSIYSTLSATPSAISTGTYHRVTSYPAGAPTATADTLVASVNIAIADATGSASITTTIPVFQGAVLKATRIANASTSTVQIVEFICVDP